MKNIILVSACLLSLFSLARSAAGAEAMVGFWPLDEGGGQIAHDRSAMENHGRICGASFAKGPEGWALEFTKRGDFVSIATTESLQVEDNFTFSAWICPDAVNEGDLLDTLSRYAGYSFSLDSGKLRLKLRTDEVIPSKAVRPGCGEFWFSTREARVRAKQWQHVACAYSTERDEVAFYVNGERCATDPKVLAAYCHSGVRPPARPNTRGKVTYAPYLPMAHITIGAWTGAPARYGQYYGLVRDVKVFRAALSEADIQNEYRSGSDLFARLNVVQSRQRKLLGLTSSLRGKAVDADTGEPLECLVMVRVGDKYYASDENVYWDRESVTGTEKPTGFVAAGEFALKLPPGKVHVEATRGPEYYLWQEDADLKDAAEKNLAIRLKRLVDMPSLGWWSGAHHEHSWGHGKCENYEKFSGQSGWKYYADAKKADGFNYVSHPAPHDGGDFRSTWTPRFIGYPTTEDQICSIYTGRPTASRDVVARLESMVKTGGHGLVQSYGEDLLMPGQVAIAMALEKIDAWQVNEADWFKYLNSGFKCCAGAGSDYYFTYGFVRNMSREYARMPELTWPNMVEAYKRHATFVTGGPLVVFKIAGKEVGENVVLSGRREEELPLSVSAWDVNGLKQIELIRNGQVVKTFTYDAKPAKIQEDMPLKINDTCWCLLKLYGGGSAVTSPIYVQFGSRPMKPDKRDIEHFLAYIDQYRRFLDTNPPSQNPKKEKEDADRAQRVFESLLTAPRTWSDRRPIVAEPPRP